MILGETLEEPNAFAILLYTHFLTSFTFFSFIVFFYFHRTLRLFTLHTPNPLCWEVPKTRLHCWGLRGCYSVAISLGVLFGPSWEYTGLHLDPLRSLHYLSLELPHMRGKTFKLSMQLTIHVTYPHVHLLSSFTMIVC